MEGIETVGTKNVSYLQARDPSMVTGHVLELNAVRVNLRDKLGSSSEETLIERGSDNLEVYLRFKKTQNIESLYEVVDKTTLLCTVPEGSYTMRNFRDGEQIKNKYVFSKIFGPEVGQNQVFNDVIKPKVLRFINGHNCTLLTYGTSGSGKTFTVVGQANDPGIIPRSLEYLFRTLPLLSDKPVNKPLANGELESRATFDPTYEKQLRLELLNPSNTAIDFSQHARIYKTMQNRLSNESVAIIDDSRAVTIGVWVSFAEIYNESIYDLLKLEQKGKVRDKLKLGSLNGQTFIKDLTQVSVSSGLDAFLILQYGLHKLRFASTGLNNHSSRSHAIFTIKLSQLSTKSGDFIISHFNICDLAGSERVKKTHNVGDRLKESNSINSSLLVLGRCISIIRESQKQSDQRIVPFRESKLTQLFQNALLGHEEISMIINVNPTRDMFDESQHALKFSAIAKDIIVQQPPKKVTETNNRFTRYIQDESFTCLETTTDNEELECKIELLLNELDVQKREAEADRKYVISEYQKIMADVREHHERQLETMKHLHEERTKIEINKIKAQYENLQKRNSKKSKIISLDTSDEDDDIDVLKNNIKRFKREIEESTTKMNDLQSELSKCNFTIASMKMEETQLEKYKQDLEKLNAENKQLKDRVQDLIQTLADGKQTYIELQNELKEYELKNQQQALELLDLQERCELIEVVQNEVARLRAYIDKLEESK